MRKWIVSAGVVGAMGLVFGVLSAPEAVNAKPGFVKIFKDTYVEKGDQASELASAKCIICHTTDSKAGKNWNKYGLALKAELKNKGAKTPNKEILDEVCKLPSATVKDKTYADLIKDGKLPK